MPTGNTPALTGTTSSSAAVLQQAPGVLGVSAWWSGPATDPAAGINSFADGWCGYARLAGPTSIAGSATLNGALTAIGINLSAVRSPD